MAINRTENTMDIKRYIPGECEIPEKDLLCEQVKDIDRGIPYADMLRARAAGDLREFCTDIYFLATEEGELLSRLWCGFGKHADAVANFGNFVTREDRRGQGIGRARLADWQNCIAERKDAPLAFFCNAGAPHLVKFYTPYGFRLAVDGTEVGPLYCPVGNSLATFREFCENYYAPQGELIRRPASVEYRHEIDCLLRFALMNEGESLGLDGIGSMEEAYLHGKLPALELYFNGNGHTVGWGVKDGKIQLHPAYRSLI